jgi:predicted  nucleic acid-binding Zn-ribbon protein
MEYKELRSKSESLSRDVDKLTAEIEKLKSQLYTQEQRYNALMTAKMLSVTDKDLEAAKMRINNLQRSVSHCITLLTEQDTEQ